MYSEERMWAGGDQFARGLRRRLAGCYRLLVIADQLHSRPVELLESAPEVEEFVRATKTFRALVVLAENGYGQQALVLARGLFESALVTIWSLHHPVESARRVDLHARMLLAEQRRAGKALGLWSELPDAEQLTADERAEADQLFSEQPGQLWTGHPNLDALVGDLIAESDDDDWALSMRRIHEVGIVHATNLESATGLANRSFRGEAQPAPSAADMPKIPLITGPAKGDVFHALLVGANAFTWALSEFVEQHAPDLEEDVRNATGLLWRAFREPEDLVGLRDDDPCPCDKANTLWGSCHKWTEALGTTQEGTAGPLVIGNPSTNDADNATFDARQHAADVTSMENDATDHRVAEFDQPLGPLIYTFTCRLPFSLGISEEVSQALMLDSKYIDENDVAHFGVRPYVRIRTFNAPGRGEEFLPQGLDDASRFFYGSAESAGDDSRKFVSDGAVDQWISMETPGGRIESDNDGDPAYAFHRCMTGLDMLLRAHYLAFKDPSVFPISTHDLRPAVLYGCYTQDGEWHMLGTIMMHPEAVRVDRPVDHPEKTGLPLESVTRDAMNGHPFVTSVLWRGRARRALRFRGDHVDCIVSLQTSVEGMLYATWRMLMVDEGRDHQYIQHRLAQDTPFKTLVVTLLPRALGGRWDVSASGTPVAQYWSDVYQVRNRIVHAGFEPGYPAAEAADRAASDLHDFVIERLWAKRRIYPRTLLAHVGPAGAGKRGWNDSKYETQVSGLLTEPLPWFWPHDVAGR